VLLGLDQAGMIGGCGRRGIGARRGSTLAHDQPAAGRGEQRDSDATVCGESCPPLRGKTRHTPSRLGPKNKTDEIRGKASIQETLSQ